MGRSYVGRSRNLARNSSCCESDLKTNDKDTVFYPKKQQEGKKRLNILHQDLVVLRRKASIR